VCVYSLSHCPSGIWKGHATPLEEKGRKPSPDFLDDRIKLLDQEPETLALHTQSVVRAFVLTAATN